MPLHKHLTGEKWSVTFTCQPFRYRTGDADITCTGTKTVTGNGNIYSMPIVKVEGNGTGTVKVNDDEITVTVQTGKPLYLDCDAGLAYTIENGNKVFAGTSVSVADDWFRLLPTTNTVIVSSGLTATITPRWRFY